jgi:drug/metabolite transporter (DMT)-like permease
MIVSRFCAVIHYLLVDSTSIFNYRYQAYVLGLLMTIVSTLIPSFLVSLAIKKLNASNFSIIDSIGPLSEIILTYLFLDERLSLMKVIGSFAVIAGIVFVSLNKTKHPLK